MNPKHTTTPWQIVAGMPGSTEIRSERNCLVAAVYSDSGDQSEEDANAAFIVRAVNSHDKLRNALRLCVSRLEEYQDAEGGTALELARAALKESEAQS